MFSIRAFLRIILFFLFFCFGSLLLNAQKEYASYPLYATAYELDTDRVTYSNHHITLQIDSTWEKGKLVEWTTASYAPNGNVLNRYRYTADEPGQHKVLEYGYNAANICVFSREFIVMKGDTVQMTEKRSLEDDTINGIYVYEEKHFFRTGRPDTLAYDFTIRYTDTKSKNRWSEVYNNRTVHYVEQHPGNDTIRSTAYGFHDSDTLFRHVLRNGANMYPVDTLYVYLSPGVMTRTVYFNHRCIETKTWESGKLTEHHVYADSLVQWRVMGTKVYNRLSPDTTAELIITYSDTLNVVSKRGERLLEDYTPDTAWYFPPEPPPPPPLTHEYVFPYRKAIPLANGVTRFEFYNFYMGTTKPLLIIVRDSRGVVLNYYQGDIILKRIVR